MHVDELSREALSDNYSYWLGQIPGSDAFDPDGPASGSPAHFLRAIPTTHTWGCLGHAIDRYGLFLYEKILFHDGALLSKNERRRLGETVPSTIGASARAMGLEDFVFAFLGGHEPYYARPEFPAFGVFIRRQKELEAFPSCNASRRDLGSPEAKIHADVISRHFLLPTHARSLAEAESLLDPRHQRDPWHYWGSAVHWNETTWQWKVEFHFRRRVELRELAAILWPIDEVVLVRTAARRSISERTKRIEDFKQIAPECAVVTYLMDPRDQARAFLQASSTAARFYVDHRGRFPQHIGPNGEVFACGE